MKQKVFLFCIILFLTGCTATYDLEIKDNTIIEKTSLHIDTRKIKVPQTMSDIADIESNNISPLIEDKNKYYQKEIEKNKEKVNINLSYQYTWEEFQKSRALNSCFTHTIFLENKEDYYIKLYDGYQCDFGENYTVKISIKTDYKVIQNNADIVNNNTYIWNIKNSDQNKKEILFQVSKKEKAKEKEKGNVLIMASIALIIGAGFIFIFYSLIQKFLNYRFRT